MRHGIRGAGALVLALTIASWIGGPAPADDAGAVPEQRAVVLELAGRRAAPTTTQAFVAPLSDLPDHLIEPIAGDAPAPATIAPATTSVAPTTSAPPMADAAPTPSVVPTPTDPPAAAADDAPLEVAPAASPSGDAPAFVSELNALRAARGLSLFSRRADLDVLAQSWAEHMAAENDLRHSDLIYDVIGGSWTTAGENIGYGPSVTVIFDALEASPGHLDNMVNPDFTSVGVGVAQVGDILWTAHLFAG